MSLLPFCQWLNDTQWSTALRESQWGYPVVESVHVLANCLFVGMAAMLDLRLLGLTMRRAPVSQVARRLLPWTVTGFIIMVISGVTLFYAIPVRSYQSIFFRTKVVLLILGGLNAWVFHSGVYRGVAAWDHDTVTPSRARFAGAASLVLWAAIIILGRMIAYNWFDCDRQPQPTAINVLEGCTSGVEYH